MANIFSDPKTNDFIITNTTNHYIALAGTMIPPSNMAASTDRAQPISFKTLGGDVCRLRDLYQNSADCRAFFDDGSITYAVINGAGNLYCNGNDGTGFTETEINNLIDIADNPLTARVVVTEASITTIQGNINSNTSSISSLQTSVSNNTTNIATNTSSIGTINTSLTTAQTNINSNTSSISSLQTSVSNNTTNIATNTSNIATQASKLLAVEDSFTAGEAFALGETGYYKSDGKVWKANATNGAVNAVKVIATETITANAIGKFKASGPVYNASWAFTIGGVIYQSKTSGALTQDISAYVTDDMIQVVGDCFPAAQNIRFNPSPVYVIKA